LNKKRKKSTETSSDSDSESDSLSSSFTYSSSSSSSSSDSSSDSESHSSKKKIKTKKKTNNKKNTKIKKTKNISLKNYEDEVVWNLYETQSTKKKLEGHSNFYMDRVGGERPPIKRFRFKNPDNTPFPSDPTPYDCFSLFFTDKLWKYIAIQTNLYAAQQRKILNNSKNPKKKISNLAKLNSWKNININDIKLVNAIYLWSGMLSNAQMEDNWSKRLLFQTNYGLVIRRTKFSMINSFLHLNDNTQPNKQQDKLFKIRPIIEYLNSKFMKYYELGNSLSIDEGMIKFNGLVSFKQYIKIKPVKYGVKAFLIADSFNYYCHKIIISYRPD